MDERSFEVLRELLSLPGPTGQEGAVIDWLEARWSPHVSQIWRSRVGNLVAHIGGHGPRLLIQAHADEIGFVVRSIDPQGFLWLASGQVRSGPAERFPVGQPALVLGRRGPVEGLFAVATGHVVPDSERSKPVSYDNLFVDVGASSREEAIERGIHVGAGVIWNPPVRRLGTRIYGKAMDDRVALAVMTLLLEQLDRDALACDLYFAATVQEENGVLGASSLRHEVDAAFAIALEVGLVGDLPTVGQRVMPTALGQGPQLVHKDWSAHYDYRLTWRIAEIAEQAGVPVQHAVFDNYGSDGAALIRQGIPTALVAVGTRYTHAAFEMIDERDVELTLALLAAVVRSPLA
uniref:M42 family peptidase n=1 Tax=Thermorudis peleae TaxID=1382356 RepID=A0A831TK06_9BACT